jgi:acyl carrier protein
MINSTEAPKRARETLVGFPPRITAAYAAFAESGEPTDLDVVVLGVLQSCLARKPKVSIETLPGSTRLAEDLGCDSLTMLEAVFMVENLFDIDMDDRDLVRLKTIDDLRDLLRQLVLVNTPVAV